MVKFAWLPQNSIELRPPVFIVAEIGINHNGDMELARESIIAAAEAGADSVKFQNYRTEDFVTDQNLLFEYKSQGKTIQEPQYDMFKRCELSRDQLAFLKETCDSVGVLFHSTPTSVEGINDLQAIGCELLKNGSDYLTNLRLVRAMGKTGLLTILSTGMATLSEIDEAVRAFRETGNQNLMLLHCTSSYPTPPADVNLTRIETLRNAFRVEVGFSDHTDGTTAAVGATILGARWIEKHFTLSKELPGPDHWFSMDPTELRVLVASIREAEKMLGSPNIVPTPSEALGRRDFRLSCVAVRDMQKGERLASSDITFQRPGDGIAPSHEALLIGLKLAQSIQAGQKFDRSHFHE
jgi:N,N'-diacetyllegionaminate synthase